MLLLQFYIEIRAFPPSTSSNMYSSVDPSRASEVHPNLVRTAPNMERPCSMMPRSGFHIDIHNNIQIVMPRLYDL